MCTACASTLILGGGVWRPSSSWEYYVFAAFYIINRLQLQDECTSLATYTDVTYMLYIWCIGACTRHSFMQVYFMNNLPNENWRYENEPITKDKILEWANEWSTFPTPDLPDGNPVPKFVRVNEKTDSNIRVKFTGMHNTFWFP